MSSLYNPYLTSSANGLTPIDLIAQVPSLSYTSPYLSLSESHTPLLPSYISSLKPVGATITFPQQGIPLPHDYNLNQYANVQKQIVKYFRRKTLEHWLYGEDMADILNYLKVDSHGVHLIDNLSQYNKNSTMESQEIKEEKIDFIGQYILTGKVLSKILKNFIHGTGINWLELYKNELFVKEYIKERLKNILSAAVLEYSTIHK